MLALDYANFAINPPPPVLNVIQPIKENFRFLNQYTTIFLHSSIDVHTVSQS